MSDSDYDPNSSGEEWSGADEMEEDEEVKLVAAAPIAELGDNEADEADQEMQDGKLQDNVQTGQEQNQRDLRQRGIPPMFHPPHAVAHCTQALTCVAKPYTASHAFGAAIGREEGTLAEGPVTVSFGFVSAETWNTMYASALPSSWLTTCLTSAACVAVAQMHATDAESAEVAKFYMAREFPAKYTMVVARHSVFPSGAHGHTCLVLRAGRVFTKSYRPTICPKPSRFVFDDISLDWRDIHERPNYADTNTEMAQLVRRTADKVLVVPQGQRQHDGPDDDDAMLTNELLKLCVVGQLLRCSQTEARKFVARSMKKGDATFFVQLGRPDGQALQRKNQSVSDETKWPMARLDVRLEGGNVTVRSVVLALASMDYPALFQILAGLDDVYANLALAALQHKLATPQMVNPAARVQTNKIVAFVEHYYRVDAGGRVYPTTGGGWWPFKALNVSRMLSSTDNLREHNGRLVCGRVRDVSVAFVFRLRRPLTIATDAGSQAFTEIVLTGRKINVQNTHFTAMQIVWNNILQNGLLPLLQSRSGHDLTPQDVREFFRDYAPGQTQVHKDGHMDRPDHVRTMLVQYNGRPLATLPSLNARQTLKRIRLFRLKKAAPSELRTATFVDLTMHDGHGTCRSENLVTELKKNSLLQSIVPEVVFDRLFGSDPAVGCNTLLLENVDGRRFTTGAVVPFRRRSVQGAVTDLRIRIGESYDANTQNAPPRWALLADSLGVALPRGEYREVGRDHGMVLRVVDKDYDVGSHGGGRIDVQIYGVQPASFFDGTFISDEEATKWMLEHRLAWFRKNNGPAVIKAAFEADRERKPDGSIGPRECPLDPDTCLLREDVTLLPSQYKSPSPPSSSCPNWKWWENLWDCVLDIQVLSGHRQWRRGSYMRGLGYIGARDMLVGTSKHNHVSACDVFPASLLGKHVPRHITWHELADFVRSQFISSPDVPRSRRGYWSGTPVVVGGHVVWTECVYSAMTVPLRLTWLGDVHGSQAALAGEDAELCAELFREGLDHNKRHWTVGRIWGKGKTHFLPEDATLRDINKLWFSGERTLNTTGCVRVPDLRSMIAFMRLQLLARYNMRGRLGYMQAETLLSDLRSHEEATGVCRCPVLASVEHLLRADAPRHSGLEDTDGHVRDARQGYRFCQSPPPTPADQWCEQLGASLEEEAQAQLLKQLVEQLVELDHVPRLLGLLRYKRGDVPCVQEHGKKAHPPVQGGAGGGRCQFSTGGIRATGEAGRGPEQLIKRVQAPATAA